MYLKVYFLHTRHLHLLSGSLLSPGVVSPHLVSDPTGQIGLVAFPASIVTNRKCNKALSALRFPPDLPKIPSFPGPLPLLTVSSSHNPLILEGTGRVPLPYMVPSIFSTI